MNAKTVFALVGLAAFAAGAGLWWLKRPPASPGAAAVAPAPISIAPGALYATSFTGADGRPQSLGQFQGQVLVLNFWATWCGPCREEMPAFDRVHARWRDKGARFVGISVDTIPRNQIADFAARTHIAFPILLPDRSWQLDQSLSGIPTTLLIDRSGRVAKTYTGPVRRQDFQADIDQLLREQSS